MQVQVNTDHNVEGHEALADHISDVVESTLGSLSDQITRVEVHLTDETGHKDTQNDKPCMGQITDRLALLPIRLHGHRRAPGTAVPFLCPGAAQPGHPGQLSRFVCQESAGRLAAPFLL